MQLSCSIHRGALSLNQLCSALQSALLCAFFFALLEALSVPQVAVWALPWEGLVADLQKRAKHKIAEII
jgi:hypothetical protein